MKLAMQFFGCWLDGVRIKIDRFMGSFTEEILGLVCDSLVR